MPNDDIAKRSLVRPIDSLADTVLPSDEVWVKFANVIINALGDVKEARLLEMIYCEQRVREFDNMFLDSLIHNVPPAYAKDFISHIGSSKRARDINFDDICAIGADPNSPVFILGYVGTGKTTFLRHYFSVQLPKQRSSNTLAIFIDCNTMPMEEVGFRGHLLDEIRKELSQVLGYKQTLTRENLEDIFNSDLQQLIAANLPEEDYTKAVNGMIAAKTIKMLDRDVSVLLDLIRRMIEKLKARGRKIWIIVDNLDHFYLSPNSRLIVKLNELSQIVPANFIVALRMISWNVVAAHDSMFTQRARHLCLSLPDPSQVVKKRLIRFFNDARQLDARLTWTGQTLSTRDLLDDIEQTMDAMAQAGLTDSFLLPLANFSIRQMLDVLMRCFQSYYFFHDPFNNKRYVASKGNIRKRLIYSLMLGNREFFDPLELRNARIINLFDNEMPMEKGNQLVRIRILQALKSAKDVHALTALVTTFREIFNYSMRLLFRAFRDMYAAGLVSIRRQRGRELHAHSVIDESEMEIGQLDDDSLEIAITSSGEIHIKQLLQQLEYIEIIKHSSHVPSDLVGAISHIGYDLNFPQRRDGTLAFVKFIADEEEREILGELKDKRRFSEQFEVIGPAIKDAVERQYAEVEEAYRRITAPPLES